MFLVIPANEIKDAPQDVQDWIGKNLLKLNDAMGTTVRETTTTAEKPATTETKSAENGVPKDLSALRQTIKEKATALAESKGMDILGPIVKGLGILKISECPDEKLDDLLAALATA